MLSNNGTSKYCCALMLIYSLLYVGFINIYSYYNQIVGFFVLFLTTIRYFILPLLILNDPNYLYFSPLGSAINRYFFYKGIMFTMWEALIVGFFIAYKFPKWYSKNRINFDKYNIKNSSIGLLSLFILFYLLMVLVSPNVLSSYSFIWDISNEEEFIDEALPSGGLSLISFMACRILKILFPIPFVCFFYKRFKKSGNRIWFLFSLLLISFFYAGILEGNSRNTIIIPAVSMIFILLKLYPAKSKTIWITITSVILLISTVSLIWKSFSNNLEEVKTSSLTYWISYIECYFAGPTNMGKAIVAKQTFGGFISPFTMFNDIMQNVPILSKSVDKFHTSNFFYFEVWNRTDQVIPSSGNGLFWFGYVLAPVVPIMAFLLAHVFEIKYLKSKTIESIFVYGYATCVISYNIYNSVSSLMMKLSIFLLPLFITIYICNIGGKMKRY